MASNLDAPSLLETAREQMQQLFKARTPPKAANEANAGRASSATEWLNLSPRASLKDALYAEELLTFSKPQGAADAAVSPRSVSSSPAATAGTYKGQRTQDLDSSAADGDGWEGGDGIGAAARLDDARLEGARRVVLPGAGPSSGTGAEPPHLESPASPRSVVDGWNALLGPQQLGERAGVLRELEGIGSGVLAALALLALAWGHGIAVAAFFLCLCREHACDVVACGCLALLGLKWALQLARSAGAHVTKLRGLALDMQGSVRCVKDMHADTHAMRTMMEKMIADFESKTTWIPTGVRPPAWLAGKK